MVEQTQQAPISMDDAYAGSKDVNVTVQPYREKNHPPVSMDDAYAGRGEAPKAKPSDEGEYSFDKIAKNMRTMLTEHENNLMAGQQGTSPYVEDHKKNFVGEANIGEDDGVYYNDNGKAMKADPKKHIVMKDPEDNKYKVYNRDPDTEKNTVAGRASSLGKFLQDSFLTVSPPVKGVATTLSEGGKIVGRAKQIENITGAEVPVPKIALNEGKITDIAARTSKAIPGGAAPFEQAAEGMRGGLEAATEGASTMGTKGIQANPEVAGEFIRDDLTGAVKPGGGLAQTTTDAFDKAGTLMKPDHTSPMTNSLKTAQKIQSRFEETRRSGISPSLEAQKILEPITDPKGVSYDGLKQLRHEIGEMINGHNKVPEGMTMGDIKQLHGAIKDDMMELAGRSGKRAVKALKTAYDTATVTAGHREKLMQILGPETRSDEGIFRKVQQLAASGAGADAKLLALAKRTVSPQAWEALKSGVIAGMGKDTKGGFNPNKFIKDYSSISERGKNIMFGVDSEHRKALDAIAEVATKFDKAKEFAEPAGELSHLVGVGAIFHHIGGALVAMTGANKISKLFANPATASSTAKWMQRGWELRRAPTPANLAAYNAASRAWASDAAKEFREGADEVGGTVGNVALKGAAYLMGLVTNRGAY